MNIDFVAKKSLVLTILSRYNLTINRARGRDILVDFEDMVDTSLPHCYRCDGNTRLTLTQQYNAQGMDWFHHNVVENYWPH